MVWDTCVWMGIDRCYLILLVFKLMRDVSRLTQEPYGCDAVSQWQTINLPECEEEPTSV